jgi:CheY-like chemotaxis protein
MLPTWARVKKAIDVASRRLGLGEPRAPQALVMTDDDFGLGEIDVALRECSWDPTFASSHGHAVLVSGGNEFELVIVDVASPSIGIEMIRDMVDHPCFQSTPLVALLDDFNPDLEQYVCDEGCVGSLHRPLSPRAMTVALRDYCHVVPPRLMHAFAAL